MCQKILSATGFAMLPGSDFGFKNEILITRIAFVDFDGTEALSKFFKFIKKDQETVMKKLFPNIYRGVNSLIHWLII